MRNLVLHEGARPLVIPQPEAGLVLGADGYGNPMWVESGSGGGGTLYEVDARDFGVVADAIYDSNGVLVSGTDNMGFLQAWAAELNKGGAKGVLPDGFIGVDCRLSGAGPAVLSPTYYPDVTHGSGDTQQSLIIRGNGGRTVFSLIGDYYPIVNFNDVFQVQGSWSSVRFQDFVVLGSDANNVIQGPFDCASFVNVIGQPATIEFENIHFFGVASLNYVGGGSTASILKSNALLSNYRNVTFWGCGAPYFGGAILNNGSLIARGCYFQDYGSFNGWYQGKTSILAPYYFIGQAESSSFGAPGKRIYSIEDCRCDEGVNIAILFGRDSEPYHGLKIDNLQCMPALSSGGAISITNAERAMIRGGNIYCRGPDTSPQIVLLDTVAEMKQVKMDSTSRTPWTGGPGIVWLESQFGPTSRLHAIDCNIDEVRGQGGVNPADPSQYSFRSMGCTSPLKFTDTQRNADLDTNNKIKAYFNVPNAVGLEIHNITTDQRQYWSGTAWLLSDGSAV